MEAGGKFVFDDEFQEMEKKMTLSQEPEEEEEEDVSDDLLIPESYKTNSQKEEHLLEIAENFQRQYLLLHPDRKPLLLYPVNEYGVRKFVSTTLRPTETGLWELQSWQECSSLVADFLSLQPLEQPTQVPTQLFSPTAVLRSQEATSFESSTLLCSLLLGLNYDAYVVSGYAVREMCLLDLRLQQCPLLDTKAKSDQGETSDQPQKKYGVKCSMELRSRFLLDQEKKKLDAEAAAILEKELQEEKSTNLPDPLQGFRVHCWVLVLSGRRSIEENFFIDPLTGCSYPTVHDSFQGIESLWNPFNYYVNRQDCSSGCKDMKFDLENSTEWEPVLHDGVSQQQLIQAVHRRMENRFIGRPTSELEEDFPRKFFLMRSWVSRIGITRKELQTRFPGGKKVTRYRKAMLERFSSTVTNDGLISRLTTYQDLSCTEVAGVKEWYKHRSDSLEEREFNQLENSTTERFKSGRTFDLLFHAWKPVDSGTEREMRFHRPEQDGLERIVVSPQAIEQSFKYRDDFLYLRQIFFREGGMIPPPYSAENGQETTLENLNVLKVVERFHRNPSKPVNEDVAQRVFLVPEMKTELLYHLMDHRTIPSRKSLKRIEDDEPITDSMFSFFLVDQAEEPPGPLTWYRLVKYLIREEENIALQIKASLVEMETIVECRKQEEKELEVFSSPLEEVMACREKWEEELTSKEEALILHRLGMDVMVPYLARLGNSESLTPEEATSFCLGCSEAFKEKLKRHTDFLQRNLETVIETQAEENDSRSHSHDPMMSQEEAELACHLCWDKKFHISAAQRRLDRHMERLEEKHEAFMVKLQQNPLLSSHFNH
ncbi:PREDICTED: dynein regulatory complex subunit 7 isoform X1 [Poecilia mexicana]|uniref:dynein regulatory complex subunit 7 isoform X1 n=1 Tax=Poecilia formosa TaxID=48698 RepID=UPI000443BFDA|nr:PREDICTED: dynein regulatory complex subunit 7 isoform X1 [Poecilia formosa]XP_014869527.1 PREDICTED: dynein regulatory complex subunit 7 isoform X1 [Poecilia mexicana]